MAADLKRTLEDVEISSSILAKEILNQLNKRSLIRRYLDIIYNKPEVSSS